METRVILIIIFILGLIYFYFKKDKIQEVTSKEIIPSGKEELSVTEELSKDDRDLIQHNQNVMTQINDYIKLSDTKNYSHDNIALGTAKLMDYHDTY